jgi:hypothetical protein
MVREKKFNTYTANRLPIATCLLSTLLLFACYISQGQIRETKGQLKLTGEVVLEKEYTGDFKIIVLKITSGIDTIKIVKPKIKRRQENRIAYRLSFDNHQLYNVIFLPDTTKSTPVEIMIDTKVPERFAKNLFYLPLNVQLRSLSPGKKSKKRLIRVWFDPKSEIYDSVEKLN